MEKFPWLDRVVGIQAGEALPFRVDTPPEVLPAGVQSRSRRRICPNFAVLSLMTRSNFVGYSAGRWATLQDLSLEGRQTLSTRGRARHHKTNCKDEKGDHPTAVALSDLPRVG